jgi:TDG/mug DNA glycosylase family protein
MATAIAASILNKPEFFILLIIFYPSMDSTPDSFVKCPETGLLPIHGESVKVLILGSFPGRQSLLKNEYYGNARNHFWQIIEILFLIDRHLPYSTRTVELAGKGVALWDVISGCDRKGSADTRITDPVFNDIVGFLASNPSLQLIALNGSTAGRYYMRLNIRTSVPNVVLPSTSPANTKYTLSEKIKKWEIIRAHTKKRSGSAFHTEL